MFVEEYLVDLRRRRFTPAAIDEYVRRILHRVHDTLWHNPVLVRSVAVSGMGILAGSVVWALVISFTLDPHIARGFLLAQAVWLALTLLWVTLHLGLMRGVDGSLPRRIGAPMILTLVRLELVPSLVVLIASGHVLVGLIAFLFAGLTDVVDGWVARRFHQQSRLGLVLDPLVDVSVATGTFVAMAWSRVIPEWLCWLLVGRYVLLLGGGLYIWLAHGPVRIAPTVLGKTSGVVIYALTVLVLVAPGIASPAATAQIRDLAVIAFAAMFGANIVQIVVIGIVNLRHLRRPRLAGPALPDARSTG